MAAYTAKEVYFNNEAGSYLNVNLRGDPMKQVGAAADGLWCRDAWGGAGCGAGALVLLGLPVLVVQSLPCGCTPPQTENTPAPRPPPHAPPPPPPPHRTL